MEISLTPQSEAFIQKALTSGETVDDIINRAIASLQRELESREQQTNWLRSEIKKGDDSGLLEEEFDFSQPADRATFWAGIDELSDKMLNNDIPVTPDSAALPPVHS
ncbi:MAG: hypothetical protein AAFS04_20940 [Cyanobacteria bacterium J06631_9]